MNIADVLNPKSGLENQSRILILKKDKTKIILINGQISHVQRFKRYN